MSETFLSFLQKYVDFCVLCAAPIIAAGDVTGVVALLTEDRTATPDAAQLKAVNVAAAFLARQMEE